MLIAAAPPQAAAPNQPPTLGLGDFDDDTLLLLYRSIGRVQQMLGWARVSSQWRRVWGVFLARVNTLNMPAAAPTDDMAAHVRRARSLVYALRDAHGLLANVRKLKIGPRHSLDVNELLHGADEDTICVRGMEDELPPPALVVLGMLIASNAAQAYANAADGVELPVPMELSCLNDVGRVILVSRILSELQTSSTPRALDLRHKLWDAPVALALLGECLKHDASLTALNLECNSIAEAGARVLGEMLEVNTSLTVLHLDHNQIGEAGAISLGKALEVNASLQSLWLGNIEIGDAAMWAIRTVWLSKSGRPSVGIVNGVTKLERRPLQPWQLY